MPDYNYSIFILEPVLSGHSELSSRVRTGPGKPEKSWNFIMAFSRTGKSWKKATGPGKFWISVKLNLNYEVYGRKKGELTL